MAKKDVRHARLGKEVKGQRGGQHVTGDAKERGRSLSIKGGVGRGLKSYT